MNERIAIAGASGFVGQALWQNLSDSYELRGLSRSIRASDPRWVRGDLFSYRDTRRFLDGVHTAVYLVHSMLPRAALAQGGFRDFDVWLADNFARAAKDAGVKQIIYLGGLIPPKASAGEEELSAHLESRLEVESCLRAYGIPVTVLRAGLIVGKGGSSLEIMLRLVERLPVMICPGWTATLSQPIDLASVVEALRRAIEDASLRGRTFDIGGDEQITYRRMLEITAEVMGHHRLFLPIPLFSPGLSRLWVSLITGAPRNLAAPLVMSLRHEMLCRNDARLKLSNLLSFREAVKAAVQIKQGRENPRAYQHEATDIGPRVVSVQRMVLPTSIDVSQIMPLYCQLLGLISFGLVRGFNDTVAKRFSIVWNFPRQSLLEFDEGIVTADRVVFRIRGGFLSAGERGKFEFRILPEGRGLLAVVDGFEPRLPWWIYRFTQAIMHLLVMRAFAYQLKHQKNKAASF